MSLNSPIDMSYHEVLSPSEYHFEHVNKINPDIQSIQADLDFCYDILPSVSRTFAISINHLRGNLHLAVFTGYLFCRIADTIEDAWRVDVSIKKQLLNLFHSVLQNKNPLNTNQLVVFQKLSLKLTGEESHLKLCHNSSRVFSVFSFLPAPTQKIITKWVSTMVEGMHAFVTKYPAGVKIQTMKEYHEYCFYVAGTVGHMLTGLWKLHGPPLNQKQEQTMRHFSASFGEGLQTINILKDIVIDAEIENNYYIPEELLVAVGSSQGDITSTSKKQITYKAIEKMISLARENLNNAFSYYYALPWRAFRIKLFCLAPLLFAFANLKQLADINSMLTPNKTAKLSRKKIKMYLLLAHCLIFSKNLASLFLKFINILK